MQWDTPHDGGTVNNCEFVVTRGGEQLFKRRPGAKKLHVVIHKLEPGTTNTNTADTANSSTITRIRKLEPGTTNTNTARAPTPTERQPPRAKQLEGLAVCSRYLPFGSAEQGHEHDRTRDQPGL